MPPSLNNAYPTNRANGSRFKGRALVAWEGEFRDWSLQHHHDVMQARAYFCEPKPHHIVTIQSDFFFEYRKILTKDGRPIRNDTTNRLKHLHDMVAKTIWLDDAWFFDGGFTKRPLNNPTGSVREFCNVTLLWVPAPWPIGRVGSESKRLISGH